MGAHSCDAYVLLAKMGHRDSKWPWPSKKVGSIHFNESPFKMMKNAFGFTLKAAFILKIFKFLYWHCGTVWKQLDKKALD